MGLIRLWALSGLSRVKACLLFWRCQVPKWGFPKIRDTFLDGSYSKDYRILASILGSPHFGKLPNIMEAYEASHAKNYADCSAWDLRPSWFGNLCSWLLWVIFSEGLQFSC